MKQGIITKVSGPLVVAEGMQDAKMYEVVKISDEKLIGEVIELRGDKASIQVYEETSGIGPGEPVFLTGESLSVELGPGLLESIYDGIQRPLAALEEQVGPFITRGVEAPGLNRTRKWKFSPTVKSGDKVVGGDIIGEVQETTLINHKIMVPPKMSGTIKDIKSGEFTLEDVVATLEDGEEVRMLQRWSIREPRPINKKLLSAEPLITGTRVIDSFFPILKGGAGCSPGPFGSGKTVTQHQIAKWSDAEVILFIGCGERGNEMTDVLVEFPELKDPKSGEPIMKRTILIANTSNMPVAAREASVYTGITIAEYYRDMGYKVALMADSTSRWAEAMREISGRLEEMPGEEGYPAYLGSRTAAFYERAGYVQCLGSKDKEIREGSLTAIGTVSPPGGDLSEPVTQNTLRVTKVFWALDAALAYRRHYPAINWLNSYSLNIDKTDDFMEKNAGPGWTEYRNEAMKILQEEAGLQEIVRLVGLDALSHNEQLLLETSKSLREDYLQQNAFDDIDAFTSLKKMYLMLKSILTYYHHGKEALKRNVTINQLRESPISNKIAKAKTVQEENLSDLEALVDEIVSTLDELQPIE
ncbi:MAG: V-type ATP synthase subunit A [bacterium]|nr:V-type ATP synthase subunit A [bacterium]